MLAGRIVCIELSEHDAWVLLQLIKRQQQEGERAWRPYWQTLGRIVARYVERAYLPEWLGVVDGRA